MARQVVLDVEDSVLMSGEDLRKYRTLKDATEKRITQREAAEKLGLTERQVRRLVSRLKAEGAKGLIHGLKGKPSNRSTKIEIQQKILCLWDDKYRSARLNYSHFAEKLIEIEGIKIGREAVRQLLISKGVSDQKPRRGPKHRRSRERKAQFGELLQQDTSPHDWLSSGEKQQMIAIVDDATSRLLFCRLFSNDGTIPNMVAMKSVFLKYGLPMGIYTDRASWFFVTPKHRTTNGPKPTNQMVDRSFKTQIDRALGELGVEFIPAYSPQAKGRVERANGTLQNRLIAELKLRKITDMEAANKYIDEFFIDDYNKRFGKEPLTQESAFVPIKEPQQLDETLCLKFDCKVAKDNTVSRQKYFKLQLIPTAQRLNWQHAKVEVRIHLNKEIQILYTPTGEKIPFSVIEFHHPKEAKSPHELPVIQKIPA